VNAGQSLAVLTINRAGINDARDNEAMLAQLQERRQSLEQQRDETVQLGRQQVEQARRRIGSLEAEAAQLDEEIRLQTERLATASRTLAKWRELQTKDFASEYKVLEYEKAAKDEEIKLQALRRQQAGQNSVLVAARADVPSATLRASAQVQLVEQQLTQVNQDIAALSLKRGEVTREMPIAAPIDGVVTNINPALGQTVSAGTAFATILPRDATLHAEMLVPTRAIGFVRPGQQVTLRYEAFPYERFGQYRGRVESVGRDVWTQGQVGPIAVREPVYRIVVALDGQSVHANGADLPLRAGMLASADLLMERRTLIEWLFQPVIQLRERMRSTAPVAS
jgi:membrane fusion protein